MVAIASCAHVILVAAYRYLRAAGETTGDNAVFLVRSKNMSRITVTAAAKEFGIVNYRDYIALNRRGINSLRQRAASIPAAAKEEE